MTGISKSSYYETCTLLKKEPHTKIDPAVCSFRTGNGDSGPKERFVIEKQKKSDCVEDCLHLKRIDNKINGVSWNSVSGNCWCLKNMQNITVKYNTCSLNTTCLQYNKTTTGNVVGKPNATSWMNCSGYCRLNKNCVAWTWKESTKNCSLNGESTMKSAQEVVSGDRMCGLDVCKFVPTVSLPTYRRMSDSKGKKCVEECLLWKMANPFVTGASVFSNQTEKGCFCHVNMTSMGDSVKTCFLKPKKSEPVIDVDTKNVTCNLQPGNGYGASYSGSEIYMGQLSVEPCLKACLFVKQMDISINGMTVHANATKPGCWCEKRMRGIQLSAKHRAEFRTCKFKYNVTDGDESSKNSTSSTCAFKSGEGNGRSTFVGRLDRDECQSTCAHVRQLDATLTGLTWDKSSHSCYCKRNMTRIGEFKTCLLKNLKMTEE